MITVGSIYTRTAIEDFNAWQAKRAPGYLVLGPWTHGKRTRSYSGDVDFGPAATLSPALGPSYLDFRLEWFDAVLGQEAEPGERREPIPRVRYFLMGGGSGKWRQGRLDHGGAWHTADSWPPKGSREQDWHLGACRRLTAEPASHEGSVSFVADPEHPVPTIGGQVTSGEPVMSGGAFIQQPDERTHQLGRDARALDQREDVASFRSHALTEDVVIAGPVTARIWLRSPAEDTDVVVKLVDEFPPSVRYPRGFGINLTEGILRGRFRHSLERPEPLEPGVPTLFEFTLPDTANRFRPGHRIRIDVASSDYPRFDVNPNTGAPAHIDGPRRKIVNEILIDAQHPSRVTLTTL